MDWAYLCVALIGLLVGSGELLNRYKDEPVKALSSFAAAFYVAVNIGAALLALVFIDAFNWVANDDSTKAFLLRVTTAGVGAMTLFRSAVFNARVGQKDVGIGLSGLLQLFLDAADRAVDRWRATPRAALVVNLMADIDFTKADAALPAFCMALMQNVSAAEQEVVAFNISKLRASTAPSEMKSIILGLTLLDIVGEEVLKTAVNQLRGQLTLVPVAAVPATPATPGSASA